MLFYFESNEKNQKEKKKKTNKQTQTSKQKQTKTKTKQTKTKNPLGMWFSNFAIQKFFVFCFLTLISFFRCKYLRYKFRTEIFSKVLKNAWIQGDPLIHRWE